MRVGARARDVGPAAWLGGADATVVMDFGAMLEGYRFGAAGSPPPRPAPIDAAVPAPDVVDPSDDSSWHVSESVDDDDAVDDADAAESARASSPPRGVKRDAPDGPSDPHDERHPRSFARRNVRNRDEDAPLSYGDAVDLDRAAAAAAASTSTAASTAASRRLFFLPRGHPARPPDPPPDRWRVALDRIRDARSGRTASVDVFHEFLLSLRGAPDAHFQALVASLLSVQCRDGVALVAARRLRDALGGEITQSAVRSAAVDDVEAAVSCCNFKRTKAKYVKACADQLAAKFAGKVPSAASELRRLPGVGPKLAHLVASVAFGDDSAGLVVDTHVRRVAERLGWTTGRECASAEATRRRLETFLPAETWGEATLLMVGFGQETCAPARPRCGECPLAEGGLCPSAEVKDVEDA